MEKRRHHVRTDGKFKSEMEILKKNSRKFKEL